MLKHRIAAAALALSLVVPAFAVLGPRTASAKSIAGRYVLKDDGKTVLDRLTGLRWQQGASSKGLIWSDAKAYCEANSAALPGSGWRLPTRRELMTLLDVQAQLPATAPVFAGKPIDYLWTSSTAVSGMWAYFIQITHGVSFLEILSKTYNVRCVR